MESQAQLFESLLKKNMYSVTKARVGLFKAFQQRHASSMQQLIKVLGRQDQASVYRNVKVFEELGIIKRVGYGSNEKLELSDLFLRHHHHVVCNSCHSVSDLQDDMAIELAIAQIASQTGFTPLDHHLEIQGLCAKCA